MVHAEAIVLNKDNMCRLDYKVARISFNFFKSYLTTKLSLYIRRKVISFGNFTSTFAKKLLGHIIKKVIISANLAWWCTSFIFIWYALFSLKHVILNKVLQIQMLFTSTSTITSVHKTRKPYKNSAQYKISNRVVDSQCSNLIA